jgi:hypothetical protein
MNLKTCFIAVTVSFLPYVNMAVAFWMVGKAVWVKLLKDPDELDPK